MCCFGLGNHCCGSLLWCHHVSRYFSLVSLSLTEDEDTRGRNVKHWTVAQVAYWVQHDVELPQYQGGFIAASVDGSDLLELDAEVRVNVWCRA